jgi:hypothetical protein
MERSRSMMLWSTSSSRSKAELARSYASSMRAKKLCIGR